MSLKESLDRANPGTLPDGLRAIKIGAIMRDQLPQTLRHKHPAADVSQLATVESFGCNAKGAPAALITRAYARATDAAGTLGELAIQTPNTTPADAQIAIAPNGDIVVLLASAYSNVDVEYVPSRGVLVTMENQPVAANVIALPAALTARGVIYLVSAEGLAGGAGAVGDKIVIAPGVAPVGAGQVNLNLAKGSIQFVVAEGVTAASFVLFVACDSTEDLDTLLEGLTPPLV